MSVLRGCPVHSPHPKQPGHLPAVPRPTGSPAAHSGSGPRSVLMGLGQEAPGQPGRPDAGSHPASGWHRCQPRPVHPGNGHRRLTLHLTAQPPRLRALHKGQLGAYSTACGDEARRGSLLCPPPPFGFDPLPAWVRGETWGQPGGSREGSRAGTIERSGAQAWALCSLGDNGVALSFPCQPICLPAGSGSQDS